MFQLRMAPFSLRTKIPPFESRSTPFFRKFRVKNPVFGPLGPLSATHASGLVNSGAKSFVFFVFFAHFVVSASLGPKIGVLGLIFAVLACFRLLDALDNPVRGIFSDPAGSSPRPTADPGCSATSLCFLCVPCLRLGKLCGKIVFFRVFRAFRSFALSWPENRRLGPVFRDFWLPQPLFCQNRSVFGLERQQNLTGRGRFSAVGFLLPSLRPMPPAG